MIGAIFLKNYLYSRIRRNRIKLKAILQEEGGDMTAECLMRVVRQINRDSARLLT